MNAGTGWPHLNQDEIPCYINLSLYFLNVKTNNLKKFKSWIILVENFDVYNFLDICI